MSKRSKEKAYKKSQLHHLMAVAVIAGGMATGATLGGGETAADQEHHVSVKTACETEHAQIASRVRRDQAVRKCVRNALAARKI